MSMMGYLRKTGTIISVPYCRVYSLIRCAFVLLAFFFFTLSFSRAHSFGEPYKNTILMKVCLISASISNIYIRVLGFDQLRGCRLGIEQACPCRWFSYTLLLDRSSRWNQCQSRSPATSNAPVHEFLWNLLNSGTNAHKAPVRIWHMARPPLPLKERQKWTLIYSTK